MTQETTAKTLIEKVLNELNDKEIDIQFIQQNNLAQKIIEQRLSQESSYFRERINREFFKMGPIEPLMKDPDITEILCNGENSIYFEKKGTLHKHNEFFLSEHSLELTINKLISFCQWPLNYQTPYTRGKYKNFRLEILKAPITSGKFSFSMRRHNSKPWCVQDLATTGWAPPNDIKYINEIFNQGYNGIIYGTTGSGKTTTLSAFLNQLKQERIITIEDTAELPRPNDLSLSLTSRAQSIDQKIPTIDTQCLLKESLRLRPDRIVMGEIRGDEAKDFLMALSTGHAGCWATIHAKNSRECLQRLEMLVLNAANHWHKDSVKNLIHLGLDYLIGVRKIKDASGENKRVLFQIDQITGLEGGKHLLKKIYRRGENSTKFAFP